MAPQHSAGLSILDQLANLSLKKGIGFAFDDAAFDAFCDSVQSEYDRYRPIGVRCDELTDSLQRLNLWESSLRFYALRRDVISSVITLYKAVQRGEDGLPEQVKGERGMFLQPILG